MRSNEICRHLERKRADSSGITTLEISRPRLDKLTTCVTRYLAAKSRDDP